MRAFVICAVLCGGLWHWDMIGRDALAHQGATGIIKERMDNFSAARGYMKAMRGAVGANDFAKIDEITKAMMPWAETMATYFPDGSDESPSEAAPTIWSDRAGFEVKIAAYQEAIMTLNAAALSQDSAATTSAFRKLGGSCKSCHQSYRK